MNEQLRKIAEEIGAKQKPVVISHVRISATRKIAWDAAHRVLRHESKCGTLHGHRYVAEITCEAPQLDNVGRVIDFGVVKEIIGKWVDDHWDHTTLVNPNDTALLSWCLEDAKDRGKRLPYVMDGEPTAENIAVHLLAKGQELLDAADCGAIAITRVRVWETTNCYADAARAVRC